MKRLWFLAIALFFQETVALAFTIKDVKVSASSDSPAAAREKALADGHALAFQKLLAEYFPTSSPTSPSHDVLMDMVTTFSIDREKSTPKTYTASLTFQFDELLVQAWLDKSQAPLPSSASASFSPSTGNSLKIRASYASLADWQHIKQTLEQVPGIQKIKIVALSPQKASLEVAHTGEIAQLKDHLRQEKLDLIPQGQDWELASLSSQTMER